jgi:hypothetical protein
VAVNCTVVPVAMLKLGAVTAMETSVAGVTVKMTAGEVMVPEAAVIDVMPTATAVASPLEPALFTGAIGGEAESQVAEVVRSWVELSV